MFRSPGCPLQPSPNAGGEVDAVEEEEDEEHSGEWWEEAFGLVLETGNKEYSNDSDRPCWEVV